MYHFKTALCSETAFMNFVLKGVEEIVKKIPYDIFQLTHF
jgi:hypothetical protein